MFKGAKKHKKDKVKDQPLLDEAESDAHAFDEEEVQASYRINPFPEGRASMPEPTDPISEHEGGGFLLVQLNAGEPFK